ncbi:MAG TPA: hypothetical protein PLJ27_07770 [Polyangiaceae bacterium]|jgi:hypothetical protein|nr:hypothetical protein [Polyangiaceae bacterium]HPB95670.1 hypothetical protein [Polyangiaceae bacterium]HQK17335.1 hypothetical protein [Polyangiaceae bacterium]HQM10251.1 hypothetical protein [Polyangiaceae bacterium]
MSRVLWLLVGALLLAACGDDERETPNCEDMSKCVTEPSGGTPISSDAGSDSASD